MTEPHHSISHHGKKPEAIEAHAKVNTYHVKLFSQFVEHLRSTPDGDGSLLDQSLILYGSGMGNGNVHSPICSPHCCWLGRGGAEGNRHIVAAERTPNADLLVSLAGRFGIELDRFGDKRVGSRCEVEQD